jgi:predicted RNA-binding protein with PIN domain
MEFLLDGYNLLHAAGFAPSTKLPKGQLRPRRERMLNWLADQPRLRPALVRVVFDAVRGPEPSLEQIHRGVRTQFAYRETADDFIERLLDVHPQPDRLVVVSNDRRVRTASEVAGGRAWTVTMFLDWLNEPPEDVSVRTGTVEKPEPGGTLNDELLALFSSGEPLPPDAAALRGVPALPRTDGSGEKRVPTPREVRRIETDLDLLAIFTQSPK